MTIQAQLADGRVLEFPDGTDPAVIQSTVKRLISEAQAPSTERTWGEAAKDIGASALGGAGALLQFPGQLVKLVPGLQGVGEALETPGEFLSKTGEDLKSAGLKAREAIRSKAISEAEKDGILSEFATAITSTIKDPALLGSFVSEQLPLLIGPLGAAKVAQKLGAKSIEAAGKDLAGEAAQKAMEEAAKRVAQTATTAAVGTGAAMQTADVSSDTFENALRIAKSQGLSDEEANQVALNAARLSAPGALASSLLATKGLSKLGGAAIERRLAGLPGTGRIRSGAGEAVSEALEEAGGALSSNIGVQQFADPTQSLTAGVGAAAGLGALGGGLFGSVLGAKPKPELAPGQREGESLYEAAQRLNIEIKLLDELSKPTEQDPARQSFGIKTGAELADMYRTEGAGAVQKYQLELLQRAKSGEVSAEEREEAKNAAQSVQGLLNQASKEEVARRQTMVTTNVITDKDVVDLGITRQDPLYKQLVGKDVYKDAEAVIGSLEAALNRKGLRQTQREVISAALTNINDFLSTVPGSGFLTEPTVGGATGEGAGVAGVPAERPAAARPEGTEPTGMVRPDEAAGELAGGEAGQPAPVRPKINVEGFLQRREGEDDAAFYKRISSKQATITNLAREGDITEEQKQAYDAALDEARKAATASIRLEDLSPNSQEAMKIADEIEAIGGSGSGGFARGVRLAASKNAVDEQQIAFYRQKLEAARNIKEQAAGAKEFEDRGLLWINKDDPRSLDTLSFVMKNGEQADIDLLNDANEAMNRLAKSAAEKGFDISDPSAPPEVKRLRDSMSAVGGIAHRLTTKSHQILKKYKTAKPAALEQARKELREEINKVDQVAKKSLKPETEALAGEVLKREEAAPVETGEVAAAADAKARRDELVKQLDGILKRILAKYGLKGVTLNLDEAFRDEGSYQRQVITMALNLDNPVRVLRHESIHALKDMGFFTESQWAALTKRAREDWVEVLKETRHTDTQSRYDAYQELFTQEAQQRGLTGDALTKYVDEAIVEEAIADAFGEYDIIKAPPGMLSAILQRMRNLFKAIKEAFGIAGIDTAEDIFGKIEAGKLKPTLPAPTAPTEVMEEEEPEAAPAKPSIREEGVSRTPSISNAWKATPKEEKQAEEMAEKDGILPYVSEGFLDVPIAPPKYSLQKYNPDKHLKYDTTLGVPINRDGTVTVYYHTTKADSLQINNNKIIPSNDRKRIYVTNESSGAEILRDRGEFNQQLDGSTVLVYVTPDMLQVDKVYPNGRVDFFIPMAQGEYFNKKMYQQSIQKARTEAITEVFSYADHEQKITSAVNSYKAASPSERRKMVSDARRLLKREHNVGSLLTENGKLEKTRIGDYELAYDGLPVASQGLGLASAQQISERVSTCPRSAICEGLCLGETSGSNRIYGGAAAEDVGDIEKSAFRAAARMMQYLKTEALIVNPEAFTILLQSEIDALKRWSASPTQRKVDPQTKKRYEIEKEVFRPAVRLNVTSDFKPDMFRGIIEGNPDVMFYDYTKLGSDAIADNHHLTYSSTGFGQIVNGEKIFFKNKAGNYDHNWATMRGRLDDGLNVAMAFSSKSALPKFLQDEETGNIYRVLDGDLYDARFLDIYTKEYRDSDGKGVIVGLRNKASTLRESNATEKTGGFFVDYNPQDGDTVVVPDQAQFKGRKIPIAAAKLSLRAPDTPQFKFWFGNSKIVDADGNPKVMYHGTGKDYEILDTKRRQAGAVFLTDDPTFAEIFAKDTYERAITERATSGDLPKDILDQANRLATAAIKKDYGSKPEGRAMIQSLKSGYDGATPEAQEYLREAFKQLPMPAGPNIIPVYVKAQYPFDYADAESVKQVYRVAKEMEGPVPTEGRIASGNWNFIEYPSVQRAIRALGFDGFYVQEGGRKSLAVYSPNQIKSVFNQAPTAAPELKLSLRQAMSPQVVKSMDKIAPPTYRPNLFERILDGIHGDTFTSIRKNIVNRYERLAEYDRRVAAQIKQSGGVQQLADSKAESAALFSDLGAGLLETAMGAHDRWGGAPVFRNGVATVSNLGGTVKGPILIFKPLSDLGDPDVFRLYQTWSAVKRGSRLNVEGREQLVDAADIAAMRAFEQANPNISALFNKVQKDWIAYNNALVKFMVDTGVITPAMAKEYTKHGDYFPFYRLIDDQDVAGPKMFTSIGNVKQPKKLKGGEQPLGDFFENIVRNSQSAIQAGIKNIAAQRATAQALRLQEVTRLTRKESGVNVYRVLENGQEVYYRSHDPLFIDAIKAMNMPDLPFIGLLAGPANLLRNLVTKDPAFMLANMMRDSLSAYVTSGVKMTPIYDTFKNFTLSLANRSPDMQKLYAAGVLGGYDYAQGIKTSGPEFEKRLREVSGKKTTGEKLATPFTSLWGALEKGTQASDAATRIEVYKRTLAETGNEAEAYWQALEVMNFNRKGASPVVRVLTAAIPFLNARMQGLDLLFRTAIFPIGGTASDQAKQRMKTFWVRGMTLMAMSSMYWLLTHDDEEYKKQEQETRDGFWLIPSLGIKIPIPFEVGVIFKVIPERIMGVTFGQDTNKDFTDAMKRQFFGTFGFNMIPQVALPIVETMTNYSFFTGRPIIGQGMENIEGRYQVGPGTSRIAELIGQASGFSPMKTDALIKGYTGTIGQYAADLFDAIYDMTSDAPKASKRFEQMPVIRRFALDPEARGQVTAYYDLKNRVDEAVRTSNLLERTMQLEDWIKYSQDKAGLLASRGFISDMDKSMTDFREMRQMVMSSPMSADMKRDTLKSIGAMESALNNNIQMMKRMAQ